MTVLHCRVQIMFLLTLPAIRIKSVVSIFQVEDPPTVEDEMKDFVADIDFDDDFNAEVSTVLSDSFILCIYLCKAT